MVEPQPLRLPTRTLEEAKALASANNPNVVSALFNDAAARDNFNVAYSADSHFLYVAYITPAASFGVLDPARNTVLSEIDTAGCVLVIPSGPNRVSSVCESGRLLTVTLNPQGQEASRALSEPFFNPDTDPVFVQGVPTANG